MLQNTEIVGAFSAVSVRICMST